MKTAVLVRRGGQDTDARREDHVSSQGGDGCLQATEQGLRRNSLLTPSSQTFSLQNCGEVNVCCLSPQSVLLVTEAQAD